MIRPVIGVSACLLGHRVRHNGDSKSHDWILGTLAKHADLVAFCPEMEMGLGAPRPTLRLVGKAESPRLLVTKSGEDLTDSAETAAGAILGRIGGVDACILKKDSPSCGLERVRVYGKSGIPVREASGFFARRLRDDREGMPLIEEGRLSDAEQREQFLIRVFAAARFSRTERTARALQAFHREYKLLLLAASPQAYRALGRIAADPASGGVKAAFDAYRKRLLKALEAVPSRSGWFNSLEHMAGYFKKELGADEKAQLHGELSAYRRGDLPLLAPLTLIRFLARKHGTRYLLEQTLFEPYPRGAER
jgi:uncharacterized protein YbgA (DUF1722 family)/uncharacterized protein YbbK (DUF523 family)